MVDREIPQLPTSAPLLGVADTLAGLAALGAAGRNRSRARIVAVTGSVGKTGTKEALRLALASSGPTYASAGGLNNHWGAPLSLARLPPDACYGVFELGMNHPGEIADLSAARAPACRGDHDGGAGASRLLPVGRGNRRCQGRDLPRAGARRRRGSQPRQPALRKIGCGGEVRRRRRDPRLWNPSGSRRAPGRLRARFARQHGRG